MRARRLWLSHWRLSLSVLRITLHKCLNYITTPYRRARWHTTFYLPTIHKGVMRWHSCISICLYLLFTRIYYLTEKRKKIFGIKEEDAERISRNDDWWCVTIRLMRVCVCRYIHFRFDSLYSRQWICLTLIFCPCMESLALRKKRKMPTANTNLFSFSLECHRITYVVDYI